MGFIFFICNLPDTSEEPAQFATVTLSGGLDGLSRAGGTTSTTASEQGHSKSGGRA